MKFWKCFLSFGVVFASSFSFASSVDSLGEESLSRLNSLMRSGNQLHDQHLYDEALKKYFAADSILPDNDVILYEIAYAYSAKNVDSLAIAYALRSLAVKESAGAFALLGDVYDSANKPDSAMKYYDLGVAFFPNDYALLYNRAVALIRMEKIREAYEDALKATKNTRKHEGSFYIAAVIAYSLNEVDEFVSNGLYALVVGNMEARQSALIKRFAGIKIFLDAYAKNEKLDVKKKISHYNLFVREGVLAVEKMNQGNVTNSAFYKSLVSNGFAEAYCRYAFQKIDPIAFESWKFMNKGKANEFKKWMSEYMRGEKQ